MREKHEPLARRSLSGEYFFPLTSNIPLSKRENTSGKRETARLSGRGIPVTPSGQKAIPGLPGWQEGEKENKMQQGAKLRRRGRGDGAPGGSRGAADKRRRAGPAHAGRPGIEAPSAPGQTSPGGQGARPGRPACERVESAGLRTTPGTAGWLPAGEGRAHSPRVELVDDALEADDGEEARAEAGQPGQEEDGEGEQRLPPGRLRQAPGQPRGGPRLRRRRRPGRALGSGPVVPVAAVPQSHEAAPRGRVEGRLVLALRGRGLRHVVPRRRVSLVLRGRRRRRRLERGVLGGDPEEEEEEEGDDDDNEEEAEEELGALPPSAPRGRDTGGGGGGGGGGDPESPPRQRLRPPRSQPRRPLRPTSHPCPPCG